MNTPKAPPQSPPSQPPSLKRATSDVEDVMYACQRVLAINQSLLDIEYGHYPGRNEQHTGWLKCVLLDDGEREGQKLLRQVKALGGLLGALVKAGKEAA